MLDFLAHIPLLLLLVTEPNYLFTTLSNSSLDRLILILNFDKIPFLNRNMDQFFNQITFLKNQTILVLVNYTSTGKNKQIDLNANCAFWFT